MSQSFLKGQFLQRITVFMISFSALHTKPSGVTLAEVLISMGILTVGLLGAAAMFPVGGHYMQQGDIADRSGAIAQAALDDAIVRGHLDPNNWVVLDIDAVKAAGPFAVTPRIMTNALTQGIRVQTSSLNLAGVDVTGVLNFLQNRYLNGHYGAAYIIDPLGMASALNNDPPMTPAAASAFQNAEKSQPVRRFPATTGSIRYENLDQNQASWWPWELGSSLPTWPVRRITTGDSNWDTTFFAYQQPIAEEFFTSNDDLAVIFPESEDNPSRNRWETWNDDSGNGPYAAARQPRGDYSWLISVSPGSARARDALATQPDAYPYDVSVVVFHKRVLGEGHGGPSESDDDGVLQTERLVNARVVTTGTAGGELLLDRRPISEDPVEESPFEELRTGQYVMLCGPHPQSTSTNPRFFLQWYRVLNKQVEGSPRLDSARTYALNEDGVDARVLVSLRGPDWPWLPANDLDQTDLLSNDLRVAIIPGAVAVHTKTMRLEAGSAWNVE